MVPYPCCAVYGGSGAGFRDEGGREPKPWKSNEGSLTTELRPWADLSTSHPLEPETAAQGPPRLAVFKRGSSPEGLPNFYATLVGEGFTAGGTGLRLSVEE